MSKYYLINHQCLPYAVKIFANLNLAQNSHKMVLMVIRFLDQLHS